jgi:NHL repeat
MPPREPGDQPTEDDQQEQEHDQQESGVIRQVQGRLRRQVYITDHDTSNVVKLAAGSNTQTVLPFTGLNTPLAVAADNGGRVYVADRGNDRVVKLSTC